MLDASLDSHVKVQAECDTGTLSEDLRAPLDFSIMVDEPEVKEVSYASYLDALQKDCLSKEANLLSVNKEEPFQDLRLRLREYDCYSSLSNEAAPIDPNLVKHILVPHFTAIFQDLCQRNSSTNLISKLTFLEILPSIPLILAERLYEVATKYSSSMKGLDLFSFRKLMQKIYYSRTEAKLRLAFEV